MPPSAYLRFFLPLDDNFSFQVIFANPHLYAIDTAHIFHSSFMVTRQEKFLRIVPVDSDVAVCSLLYIQTIAEQHCLDKLFFQ